ncbi:MAG: hypothetical protein Q4B91_01745 [Atopobiaceae bacterium]|nr:hypothetical protein [Atopobiaceae bacterium]
MRKSFAVTAVAVTLIGTCLILLACRMASSSETGENAFLMHLDGRIVSYAKDEGSICVYGSINRRTAYDYYKAVLPEDERPGPDQCWKGRSVTIKFSPGAQDGTEIRAMSITLH